LSRGQASKCRRLVLGSLLIVHKAGTFVTLSGIMEGNTSFLLKFNLMLSPDENYPLEPFSPPPGTSTLRNTCPWSSTQISSPPEWLLGRLWRQRCCRCRCRCWRRDQLHPERQRCELQCDIPGLRRRQVEPHPQPVLIFPTSPRPPAPPTTTGDSDMGRAPPTTTSPLVGMLSLPLFRSR
jgi:hypothetical protein